MEISQWHDGFTCIANYDSPTARTACHVATVVNRERGLSLNHTQSALPALRAKAPIVADPALRRLFQQIQHVARTDAGVLLTGEGGTGKELIARHLHHESLRTGRFVAVNCGALSPALSDHEIFGSQASPVSGARETFAGWCEEANGGTLFLDDVGQLHVAVQCRLLGVLQDQEIVRVGSRKSIPVDLRVVAATSTDLRQAVTEGTFRRDLYYLLSVAAFSVPPLRERRADIIPLAEHFLELHGQRPPAQRLRLAAQAAQSLLDYPWPGNVRELENVVHAALLTAEGVTITADDIRFRPVSAAPGVEDEVWRDVEQTVDRLFESRVPRIHERLQDLIVRRAFMHGASSQVKAAELLGISRSVVRTLLRRAGLLDGGASG